MKNSISKQISFNGISYNILLIVAAVSFLFLSNSFTKYAYAHEADDNSSVTVNKIEVVENEITDTENSIKDINEDNDEDNKGDEDSKDIRQGDDIGTIKEMFNSLNTEKPAVTIVATKIVCDEESKLPNWGLGGPDVTSDTATNFVASNPGCSLVPDWKFQWGFSSVNDLGGNFIGEADGSKGPNTNTGTGLTDWKTFGATDASGVATTKVYDVHNSSMIWVREVMKEGYVPFTFDMDHRSNDNNVSAEIYCHKDVGNFDNYDFIINPELGSTYFCVAFNALKPVIHVNTAPVISILGQNPSTTTVDSIYIDLGATVFDAEDGDITTKLVTTSLVNTNIVGAYTITYNATDTQNLAAITKTRTVNVVATSGCSVDCVPNTPPTITVLGSNPQTVIQNNSFVDAGATAFDLEDGVLIPTATGTVNTTTTGTYIITYSAIDSNGATATPKTRTVNVVPASSGNQKPEITLLGEIVMQLTIGSPFTDPSATVNDAEDGNITNKLVATGTVDVNTIGVYVITYNATDTKNLAADTKTRTINIVAVPITPPGCTVNCGGGSSDFKYYGCTNKTATNYNSLANTDDGSCVIPGGGGGGSVPLTIANEKLVVTSTTSVTISWTTNLPSNSRVVYGEVSVSNLGAKPSYGYPLTTATDTTSVNNHSMVIEGIPSALTTYFRPISATASETATGIQLSRIPASSTPLACEYLKEYMRLGANNNPTEVTKLQLFLKNYEGFSKLEVTGIFDVTTDSAVRAFQDRYKADVLDTWNLTSNTGYVYYTTEKKINEIYCKREFPLSSTQISEIASFRNLIQKINTVGTNDGNIVLPLVGVNTTGPSIGEIAGASTETTPVTVTVSSVDGKTNNDFKSLNSQSGNKGESIDSQTAERRGRIAIADLLATAPSVSEDIMDSTNSDDSLDYDEEVMEDDLVASGSTKQNLVASVINSLSSRTNLPTRAIYFIIFLLLLAIAVTAFYYKKILSAVKVSPLVPMLIEEKKTETKATEKEAMNSKTSNRK